jgi:transcriptional regulator with XRE-family HTH domain
MKSTREGLWGKLRRLRFRRAFIDSNVGVQIAAQLYALRESRKLSQEKLAELIGMGQARISLLEDANYQRYNIKTLKRLAAFYDVALDVRFVPFKEFINRIINQTPRDMAPPSFDEEMAAQPMAEDGMETPEWPAEAPAQRQAIINPFRSGKPEGIGGQSTAQSGLQEEINPSNSQQSTLLHEEIAMMEQDTMAEAS